MANYLIDGHNLNDLFDTQTPRISFGEDPRTHIPKTGSIIYSVWDYAPPVLRCWTCNLNDITRLTPKNWWSHNPEKLEKIVEKNGCIKGNRGR